MWTVAFIYLTAFVFYDDITVIDKQTLIKVEKETHLCSSIYKQLSATLNLNMVGEIVF